MKSKFYNAIQKVVAEPLSEKTILEDPFRQFTKWFGDAVETGVPEPDAMFLATVNKEGKPSGRVVLLKEFSEKGFVFFTNYNSRKGSDISVNPLVALVFHWKELERQVRITGRATKVNRSESDRYFSSRPLGSRVSAIVSPQSMIIPGKEMLEQKMEQIISSGEMDVKRPEHWGGYRIKPDSFEFWQGREHRLHDRFRFCRFRGKWKIERLAP